MVGARRRGAAGFTLIELLVVVIIIGILAAIALPKIFSAICTSNQGAADGVILGVNSALTLYVGENRGHFPDDVVDLTVASPAWFTKYYEVPSDPFGSGKMFRFHGPGSNDYTVCFEYNGGVGCDGIDANVDDVVYFNSQHGAMRTGNFAC